MLALKGNILSDEVIDSADAICIPTNGQIKKDGTAIMGAGLAKQALNKWPDISTKLGHSIIGVGNITYPLIKVKNCWVMSFPTKTDWKKPASLELIGSSAARLRGLADFLKWKRIILPPVGCGLGGLSMDVVMPVLEKYLDDRFYIINFK